MTTVKAISAAMKLIDVKKQNLKKAFEDLQAQSSSLSSFTLTWSDLDSHFSSLQSTLQYKFSLLQTPDSQSLPPPIPFSSAITNPINPIRARPELKSFCEKMDGLGLRNYIINRPKERAAIRVELPDALGSAPDAAALVLDAVEGFSSIKEVYMRRVSDILLEELMGLKIEVKGEVRKRAMELAVEWKANMGNVDKSNTNATFEVLGFLLLVAVYGLAYGFSMDELMDYAVIVAKTKIAIQLCRLLNFGDRISDIIQKLISNGKQILAVKFICEFKMTDEFPPVPLLKAYAKESKDIVQKIRTSGDQHGLAMKEATTKEISDLKSVIKCIEDYKLESEYPKRILLQRVEKLEKEKLNRKRGTTAPTSVTEQQSKPRKESMMKRAQTTEPAGLATISTTDTVAIPLYHQPPLQTAGFLPDPDPYLTAHAVQFGMADSKPAIGPYSGSYASPHELSGAPMSFYGNGSTTASNLYPSGSQMPLGYYDGGRLAYGGYGNVSTIGSNVYPSGGQMPSGYNDGQIVHGGYGVQPEHRQPYYPQ